MNEKRSGTLKPLLFVLNRTEKGKRMDILTKNRVRNLIDTINVEGLIWKEGKDLIHL